MQRSKRQQYFSAFEGPVKGAVIVLIIIIELTLDAFVLMKYVEWLVVPIFECREISLAEAFAISLLLTRFKTRPKIISKMKEEYSEILTEVIAKAISVNGLALLLGYVASKLLL